MKKTGTKRSITKYVILLFAVAAGIFAGGRMAQAALENDNDSSVRSVHVTDDEIEVSTLVVGSHLIHIQGLSETIYAAALDSANEFGQNKLYYKSELADGQWFEITDAASIADITTEGTLVSESEIEALEFTHRTDAAGVTTDLRTGETVSVFDINSPYDLEAMEELEPLKLQYDMLQAKPEGNRSDSDERYIEMIRELFATDVRSEDCIRLDGYLEALGRYKEDLTERASGTWVDMTDEIMESVDAMRRVFVYYQLDEYLDALLNRAQGISVPEGQSGADAAGSGDGTDDGDGTGDDGGSTGGDGTGDDGGSTGGSGDGTDDGGGDTGDGGDGTGEDTGDGEAQVDTSLVVNTDVVAAIGDCISNVQSSLSTCEAKLLVEGTTVISKYRYDTANDLIAYAVQNDYSHCDTLTAQLCALKNIIEEKVVDVETELSLLDSVLVARTRENYENALKAGASADYVSAIAGGASAAAGERYLKEQKSEADALRSDYQIMLTARWKRVKNEEAVTEALNLLDGIAGMNSSVQEDDAKSYLQETVEAHRLWLQESYAGLLARSGADSEMDALNGEKERLQQQYQDALDRNNLSAAALLEAQLAAVSADIDALEQKYLAILNSENSSESDKAKAAAGLGDGTAASAIENLKGSFLNALGDSGTGDDGAADSSRLASELSGLLSALGELAKQNPQAAAGALDEIGDALSKGGALSDGSQGGSPEGGTLSAADRSALLGTVGEMHQEAEKALGNSTGATMSAAAVMELLNAVMQERFGTDYENASLQEKAEASLAVEWFGRETGNSKIAAQAGVMAQQMQLSDSPYVFGKYRGDRGDGGASGGHISLHAAGRILGYRTIFDNVHVVETLSGGMVYYTFTNGRRAYETGGQTKMLKAAPVLQERQLYLEASDGKELFGLDVEEIENSELAFAYTEDMKAAALELLQSLGEGV